MYNRFMANLKKGLEMTNATQKKLRGPWVAVAIAAKINYWYDLGDRTGQAVKFATLEAERLNAGKCAIMIAVKMAKVCANAIDKKLLKNCIVEPGAVVNLPNGDTALIGGGGTYRINGDVYPVTIVAVAKKGHRIVYRSAEKHGKGIYTEDKTSRLEVATLRKRGKGPEDWVYQPKGGNYSYIRTNGYSHRLDPSF